MRLPKRCLALALGATLLGCDRASAPASAGAAPFSGSNPFASASPLLYQAPPFDRIHDADYQPAVEEGMRRQLAEVAAIASDTAAPGFDNTIVALERSGALLTRAFKVFNAMTQANTDDTLQRVQTEEAPRLAAHLDAILLNDALFRRVRSVYERRADLGFDSVQTFLVERYYRDFVRAGALLAEPDKARLRALNQEESRLATDFQNRLLAATKAGAVVVGDKNELDGLSDADIAAAAEAARERKLDGKWLLSLQNRHRRPCGTGPCGNGCSSRRPPAPSAGTRMTRGRSSSGWRSCAPSAPSCSATRVSPLMSSTTGWPRHRTRRSSC